MIVSACCAESLQAVAPGRETPDTAQKTQAKETSLRVQGDQED